MSSSLSPVILILGDQEFLIERAISSIIVRARKEMVGGLCAELSISRTPAGDVSTAELTELLSPSLFAEDRVVILDNAAQVGKDSAETMMGAVSAPIPGAVLIIVHSGGGRAKALVKQITQAGAPIIECHEITRVPERIKFVRDEFKAAGVRVDTDTIQSLLDAVGSNLREIAMAVSQLVFDTEGKITAEGIRTYYAGKAEVSGFAVADFAVIGEVDKALESLRWASFGGVNYVPIADALGNAVHAIASIRDAGHIDPYRDAARVGLRPFVIQKAQRAARHWDTHSLARAIDICAELNAAVKGAAASPDYALEAAVREIALLAT